MKIEGQFLFEKVPADTVWTFLTDPHRIVSCLPGCQQLVPTTNGAYEMTMTFGVGSVCGTFTGSIRLHDVHPTTDYRMTVSGNGAVGFVNGEGTIRLNPADGGTHVTYTGDVSVGGTIAGVGQRMIGGAARMMIDRFFKCASNGIVT
jgi:carbon monoxide dehydrogenase subunit G